MLFIADRPTTPRRLCYQVTQKDLALIARPSTTRTCDHPRQRKNQSKTAAAPQLTIHKQLGFVGHRHMLHNRQPQAGSAGRETAAFVDAVEALGQTRDMLGRNAGPLVLDAAARARPRYRSISRQPGLLLAILQRVDNEVTDQHSAARYRLLGICRAEVEICSSRDLSGQTAANSM